MAIEYPIEISRDDLDWDRRFFGDWKLIALYNAITEETNEVSVLPAWNRIGVSSTLLYIYFDNARERFVINDKPIHRLAAQIPFYFDEHGRLRDREEEANHSMSQPSVLDQPDHPCGPVTPVYVLIDRSASISGANIFALSSGIELLYEDFEGDGVERCMVSLIGFNSFPFELSPCAPAHKAPPPPSTSGVGSSDLGAALVYTRAQAAEDLLYYATDEAPWLTPRLVIFTDDAHEGLSSSHWISALQHFSSIQVCTLNEEDMGEDQVFHTPISELRTGDFTALLL